MKPCRHQCEIDSMCRKCARFQRQLAVKAGVPRKIYVYAIQAEYMGQYSDRTYTYCDSYKAVYGWRALLAEVRRLRDDGYDGGKHIRWTAGGNITSHIIVSAQPFRELELQCDENNEEKECAE